MATNHLKMRTLLPEWRETLVVFEDNGVSKGCLDLKAVDLTARQKRKRCERGYAREYVQVLQDLAMDAGLDEMVYRFVFLETPK